MGAPQSFSSVRTKCRYVIAVGSDLYGNNRRAFSFRCARQSLVMLAMSFSELAGPISKRGGRCKAIPPPFRVRFLVPAFSAVRYRARLLELAVTALRAVYDLRIYTPRGFPRFFCWIESAAVVSRNVSVCSGSPVRALVSCLTLTL